MASILPGLCPRIHKTNPVTSPEKLTGNTVPKLSLVSVPNGATIKPLSVILVTSITRFSPGDRHLPRGEMPFRNRQVMGSTPIVGFGCK